MEDPNADSQADGIQSPSTGSLMSETRTKCELYSAVQTRVTDNNAATRLTWEDKTDRGNMKDNQQDTAEAGRELNTINTDEAGWGDKAQENTGK